MLKWRLVHAGGQGGDNRLGGTVKCHCGTSRNCHHFERARGWSEEGIIYFQSQACCSIGPELLPINRNVKYAGCFIQAFGLPHHTQKTNSG